MKGHTLATASVDAEDPQPLVRTPVWTCRWHRNQTLPPSQHCHQPRPETAGFADSTAQLLNETSACVCLWMLTEAVTKAIVTIKDFPHSIHFPSWFRGTIIIYQLFFSSWQGVTLVGALTSAMWLTSVPVLRTACDCPVVQISLHCCCSTSTDMERGERQKWPHEGVQSTEKCGSMQPIWMTQLLIAFFPAGEMCGFVKYFRKKKVLKLISPSWKLYLYISHAVCSVQKLPLKHLLFLFWILKDTSHPLFYSAFISRMMKSKVWF